MSAWYEADDELEALFGEEKGGFRPPRSFRAPTPRPFSPPRSTTPPRPSGAGAFRADSSRPGSWRQRRRWPWLIYGARPYANGYGFPVFPPRSDAEPEPRAKPLLDEEGEQGDEIEYVYKARPEALDITISAWTFRTFTGHPATGIPEGGGVYIVVYDQRLLEVGVKVPRDPRPLSVRRDDMLPIYVGEAKSFQKRWGERLHELHRIGITKPRGQLPKDHLLHVWFGAIPGASAADMQWKTVRERVEHIIIRTLILGGVVPPLSRSLPMTPMSLRNDRSFAPMRPKGGITIQNLLPDVPWWKKKAGSAPAVKGRYNAAENKLKIEAATNYEFFFG